MEFIKINKLNKIQNKIKTKNNVEKFMMYNRFAKKAFFFAFFCIFFPMQTEN